MKIHHLSAEEALRSLQSGPGGLSEGEARRRLLEFGSNRIERVRQQPLISRFLKGFTHFFALILWLAAALAFFAEFRDPGHGMGTLGYAILGVILINGLFSFWQEYRAEQAIAALQQLLPREVKVLRDGKLVQIPAEVLVPGDVILLAEGDDVPADCRLIDGFGVRVNTATITGESLLRAKDAQPSQEDSPLQSRNVLLAGTSLVSGEGRAVVFATGMHTEFGKIAHLTQATRETLSPLQQEIGFLSQVVALLAVALGGIFFLVGRHLGFSLWEALIFAIGIIVANVPEGLLPTVTLALAMGSQRMARRNALVRYLPAVETLGSATVICTDKTGTLTQNRMTVKRFLLDGRIRDPSELRTHLALHDSHRLFFEGMLLCHSLKAAERNGKLEWLGDPMELALLQAAEPLLPAGLDYTRVDEIPFDAERKRQSALYRTPQGLLLYSKGALETVLPLCRAIQTETGEQPLDPILRENIQQAQVCMAEQGLRVLAFAHRRVADGQAHSRLEADLVFDGLVGLEDPPRPEVPDAIGTCREAGIRVIMITGDHPQTAAAVAREIGLVRTTEPKVITGEQLGRMSDVQLQLALDAPEILFARTAADQKQRIVAILRRKCEIVAVTGDGVNDAPALREADIGIAMGVIGTDVARQAADMVLMDDNFASIVAAVEEGRAVFANIRKFLTYILTSNVPELIPYLAFALFKIPLPLTIIQILAVDLGTDMLPALALGTERPDPQVMQRPPRTARERLLDWPLLLRAYLFLGMLEAAAAMAAFFFVLHGGGWHYGEDLAHDAPLYLQATTACLSAIIAMQVVNVFLCRSELDSVLAYGLSGNRLLIWGVAVEVGLILVIDYTPWGNAIFGTAPIGSEIWLFIVPFAVGMLGLEEVRKAVVKGWLGRGSGRAGTRW